jgi:hypothetical protein
VPDGSVDGAGPTDAGGGGGDASLPDGEAGDATPGTDASDAGSDGPADAAPEGAADAAPEGSVDDANGDGPG